MAATTSTNAALRSTSTIFFFSLFFFFVNTSSESHLPAAFQTLHLKSASSHDEQPSKQNFAAATPSLELQLIHRNVFESVVRSKEELLLGQLSRDEQRLKWIHKKLTNGSSKKSVEDFNGPVTSGLTFGSGEYFVRIGVGSPARTMYLVLDTGSDIPWLQCSPCKRCYKQYDPIFDPKASSSFRKIPCASQLCKQLDIHGCIQGTHCVYQVSYGDGSFTVGDFSSDTFSFGSSSVSNVAFGCGFDNEGLFAGAGGLLGLGGGKLSFASQVGSSYGNKFSYCLVNRGNPVKSSSTLMFGNSSIPQGASFTPLLKNPKLDTFYYAQLTGISIAGTLLSIPSTTFRLSESGTGGVIIDSGTSVTRLPISAYGMMREAFRNGTRKLPAAPKFSLFDTCYNFSKLQSVDVPTVTLHFQNGAHLHLPPTNYMVPINNAGTYCFAFAGTSMDLSIIGNIQQQGIRFAFDTQTARIAFAPQQWHMAVEEYLDVLSRDGAYTGMSKSRHLVHNDGDYHRAVHVWIYAESTGELLLQKRADCKDSWPGLWDISSAGHISAGDTSLETARRELEEELGIVLPHDAFELLFVFLQQCVINEGTYINNEYNDVYLVTMVDPIPLELFTLQKSEVSDVKYITVENYKALLKEEDPAYVPCDVDGGYHQLFAAIEKRCKRDTKDRITSMNEKLSRYIPVKLNFKTEDITDGDKAALSYIIRAAQVLDHIFLEQEWMSNPDLKDWLEKHAENSELDRLKYSYFCINKSPWSCLDENEAYLTSADSAIKKAVQHTSGKSIEYRAAFPTSKPLGSNFYPPDMQKEEFDLWKMTLTEEKKADAMGFFTVIRRSHTHKGDSLISVKYSDEYKTYLTRAADFLHKAADVADTHSLKKLLKSKAEAFLSNDYYESDIAWIELDSPVDVTIGPYETYEDGLFGYKATFEAFIGIRDHVATTQVKLFSEQLQNLEDNLPLAAKYKSKDVKSSPIRVIQLLYNSGDVKGPQTVAFNLPNDERIVKKRGSAMVILKNISQAKFDHILLPIAQLCISESQRHLVNFDAFFTHTLCHECCHGIGPHNIVCTDGRESTVRLELQELHSALEEAKADIVGLWALQYLVDMGFLAQNLEEAMYVSFLAGCIRSVRFGLEEAHGKGQALQFNWLFEKGAFVVNSDNTIYVCFEKVREGVSSLSNEIMSIQGNGDKSGARLLLEKYGIITHALEYSLSRLNHAKIPVDIAPIFEGVENLL